MWENYETKPPCRYTVCVTWSGARSFLSLIAQTSYHMFFSSYFFSTCGQVLSDKTHTEVTAAWFVKVNPYNLVRKKWVSIK